MSRIKEYKLPLLLAFVDYEKAFNSIIEALMSQGTDNPYIYSKFTNVFLKNILIEESTKKTQQHLNSSQAIPEHIFRKLYWIKRRIARIVEELMNSKLPKDPWNLVC